MTMTIQSATYANAEHTAAIAMTAEVGAVALSAVDTPEVWADLLASNVTIAAYVAPPAPVPETISDRQFFQGLALSGLITQEEALAAVGTGVVPAAMAAFIDQLPLEQQFGARMVLSGAVEFHRSHPLTAAFGAMQGMTSAQIDDLWRFCAGL